jgi:hypothetical protein
MEILQAATILSGKRILLQQPLSTFNLNSKLSCTTTELQLTILVCHIAELVQIFHVMLAGMEAINLNNFAIKDLIINLDANPTGRSESEVS